MCHKLAKLSIFISFIIHLNMAVCLFVYLSVCLPFYFELDRKLGLEHKVRHEQFKGLTLGPNSGLLTV